MKSVVADYNRLFYYDALPIRERDEDEAAYLSRTAEQRVILERAAAAQKQGQGGLEQKKVDVMIAVDMLTHTFRRNMHQAALLTGDNDFKPVIDALVTEGMNVALWFPPRETNSELVYAADSRRPLDLQVLWNWMTDESKAWFRIPLPDYKPPSEEEGHLLTEWRQDNIRFQLRQHGETYVVLRDVDELNRLHIAHENFELLTMQCKSMGYGIPPLAP